MIIKGISMQSLRDGQWGAEFQLQDDGANHPQLRGPKEAEETGQVLVAIIFNICAKSTENSEYTTHLVTCFPLHQMPRSKVFKNTIDYWKGVGRHLEILQLRFFFHPGDENGRS